MAIAFSGPLAPNVTISQLEEKDCIVLVSQEMEWQDARNNCKEKGGDLLVTRDLEGLKSFLGNHYTGE